MNRRNFLLQTAAFLGAINTTPLMAEQKDKTDKTPRMGEQKDLTAVIDASEVPTVPFVPGSWTLVILPDTQNYAETYPGLLKMQTRWIVENKDTYNIAYVLQNGDLTDNNADIEWQRVDQAFKILDAANIPYAVVPGNHDYSQRGMAVDRTTKINNTFPPKRFEQWPTFGGAMTPDCIENNYHLFEAGSRKWLVIGLEWGPRNQALEWANFLLEKYPDRKTIIFTHAYLYSDSTRYDWAAKGLAQDWNPHKYNTESGVNDGEEMWQKCIKKHPNVFMVINGHVCHDGLGFQVSTGDHGNRVNEMLVNYQALKVGGGAWLRMLHFLPDNNTVQVRDYTPLYEVYNIHPDNQFTFTID